MDQVPFTPSVVAITGGTIVGAILSGCTILASTLSGNTLLNSTISGGTAIGISLTGSTFQVGSISGSTIAASNISGGTMVGTALSGVSINNPTILVGTISGSTIAAPTISGGTHVGGTFSGNTFINPTISGGTAVGSTLSGVTFLAGTINNSIIGGSVPVAGTFTALTANLSTAQALLTISDNAAGSYGTLRIRGGSGHYNYQIGANDLTNQALTIAPSTATDGTTFSTAAITIAGASGAITLGSTITAAAGIIFSNETLSTYDEGTWTPTIYGAGTAGTPTYTAQFGKYTRVGNVVVCIFRVAISAKTGIAGNVQIGGLPFTIDDGSGADAATPAIGYFDGLTFGIGLTHPAGYAQDGTTFIGLYASGSGLPSAVITDAGIAAATEILGTILFHV